MSDNKLLRTEIACLYYMNGYSKTEIARITGFTRQTISVMLDTAIRDGTVEIIIHERKGTEIELAASLKNTGLFKEVKVIPGKYGVSETSRKYLGRQTSELLDSIMKPNCRLGIGKRKIIRLFAENYSGNKHQDCLIIPLSGETVFHENKLNTDNIDRILAEKMGANYTRLFAPVFSFSEEEFKSYYQSEEIRTVTEEWDHLDAAIFGLSDNLSISEKDSSIFKIFPREYMELLRSKGAVGNTSWRHYDIHGNEVWDPSIQYYPMSITLEQLKKTKEKIVLAFGAHKIPSICGAINGGLLDHLITDEPTGIELLKALDNKHKQTSQEISS